MSDGTPTKPTREQLIQQLESLTDDLEPIVIERVPLNDGTGRVLVMTPAIDLNLRVTDGFWLSAICKNPIAIGIVTGRSRDSIINEHHSFIKIMWERHGEPETHTDMKWKVLNAMRVESPAAPEALEALEALEGNADE